MSEPTNAEISAAAEAVINYMLSHEAKDRPAAVTAIHVAGPDVPGKPKGEE